VVRVVEEAVLNAPVANREMTGHRGRPALAWLTCSPGTIPAIDEITDSRKRISVAHFAFSLSGRRFPE
jgi:hypothetical protein